MATTTKTPRKPRELPLAARLAHEHNMSVRMSTATLEILEKEDGIWTRRLVRLGNEYATFFMAEHGLSS